ncbi:type II CAAX endopeptidase family protein [Corallococcus macrosporus]|uniref:CAAX amino protease n=1 Tax=Corallococcus macrosporus DSM 14697 TaxID=1189310 RepID=A0A250JVV0_9BACT|nr:type II CAAX endopeptidase family protein [Corallococcus macrosporus]ATB47627.1 CAAX amino protease [Corallococcus macrosporus DSM 14697]
MEDSSPSDVPPPPPGPPPGDKPSASPKWLAVVGAVLALGTFILVGGTVQLANPAFGIWFTELVVFFGLGWVMLRHAGWRPAVYTGLLPAPKGATLLGFLLGVANFFAVVVPIQFLAQSVAPEWLTRMFDSSRLFADQTPLELALILTGVSVAAPVCEEFFFRGIFQRGITPPAPAPSTVPLVVSAVVFSAFHLDPVGFLARTELGLLFGWLFLRTGSLWPGIGAHAANNLVSSVLFLSAKALGAESTDAASEATDPRLVLVLAAVGWAGLSALLSYARRNPAVWGPGTLATDEEARAPGPRPSLARLLLPWVVGATASLGLLVAVDSRGLALNFYDAQHPLPTLEDPAPPAQQAERKALSALRAAARRGELPMEAYYEERERQIRVHPLQTGPGLKP